MKRTFVIRFSAVYAHTRAPKPVTVTVDDEGKTPLETEIDAIVKAMEEHDINDEAFRPHATLIQS